MKSIELIIAELKGSTQDRKLSDLYCRPTYKIGYYKDRLIDLAELFKEKFGKSGDCRVGIYTASGRTEICGNHTDHQRGRVLTGSVDVDAIGIAAPNGTSIIKVHSVGFGDINVDISNLEIVKEEENTSMSLIRGIAAKMASEGHEIGGFDLAMTSDVPGGSGLSSSACFEVLIGEVINDLFCDRAFSNVDIAKIGQYAENVYFGKPSGLMDQMGCAVGGIVFIDFKDKEAPILKHVNVDFSKFGYALCIIDSGAGHEDLTDAYSGIPKEMKAAAAVFGKEVLSEVPEDEFYSKIGEVRKQCGDRAVLRAIHYYNDNENVLKEVAALEKGNIDEFLQIVRKSGNSSYKYLQNISTYDDVSVQPVAYALAVAQHALGEKGAVRVHGGGFAGTILAFVPQQNVTKFSKAVDAALFKGACKIMHIRPVGGAVLA